MWEYTTLEVLQDFTRTPMQKDTIQMLIDHFELDMYHPADQLRTATNLSLVYGEQEYTFSSDDLVWLGCCDAVLICHGDGRNLFFAEMNVEEEDYYISCSAIIKLFNCVFPGNNQFIFKVSSGLAFGCKRSIDIKCKNNFCVTRLFSGEGLKECVYFLEEAILSDEESLPYAIMEYSPQEQMPEYKATRQSEASQDYIRFLREVNSIYGIDTSAEYSRYIDSFTQALGPCRLSYLDVCTLLQYIGEPTDQSSYDVLNDALAQEELTKNIGNIGSADSVDDLPLGYSPEVLMDAERLLKEMLKKGTQTD